MQSRQEQQQPPLNEKPSSSSHSSSLSNPFTQNGMTSSSDLDFDHGFPDLCLPDTTAEDSSRFRVEITNFYRNRRTQNLDNGQQQRERERVWTSPKRILNRASVLRSALRDGSVALAKVGGDTGEVKVGVGSTSISRLTIITIPQQFSGGPLNITRKALQDLIQQLDIPITFLPVLYAFGSVPRISEAGLDCFTNIKSSNGHDANGSGSISESESFSLNYLYRFKDRDVDRSGTASEWKDRQIGVFHRHSSSMDEDLFVVLQPHADSRLDGAIEDDVQPNHEAMTSLMDSPICLHQLLISSYFDGWREYLKDVADDFAKCSAQAFSQDIVKDYSLDFHFLQRWRNTTDNIIPIAAALDSIKRIINGLQESQRQSGSSRAGQASSSPHFDVFAQMVLSQTTGLGQSAQALEKRIANIAELLTNTIESKNQLDAARLNRHMERLTVDTVDDSSSVRIITFLSLIYLPGSFVATLFGMNLFGFDSEARRITIAKNFWLYIVIFLPLTAITFSGAWTLSDRARKRRDERQRIFGLIPPR